MLIIIISIIIGNLEDHGRKQGTCYLDLGTIINFKTTSEYPVPATIHYYHNLLQSVHRKLQYTIMAFSWIWVPRHGFGIH